MKKALVLGIVLILAFGVIACTNPEATEFDGYGTLNVNPVDQDGEEIDADVLVNGDEKGTGATTVELSAGSYDVVVEKDNYTTYGPETVDIVEGEDTVLKAEDVILDEYGYVEFEDALYDDGSKVSEDDYTLLLNNEEGDLPFRVEPGEEYNISSNKYFYYPYEEEINLDVSERITLTPVFRARDISSAEITVNDEEGEPLEEVEVGIDGELEAETDRDGVAEFDRVLAGENDITISLDGYTTIRETINISEEEEFTNTFELEVSEANALEITFDPEDSEAWDDVNFAADDDDIDHDPEDYDSDDIVRAVVKGSITDEAWGRLDEMTQNDDGTWSVIVPEADADAEFGVEYWFQGEDDEEAIHDGWAGHDGEDNYTVERAIESGVITLEF